MANKFKILKDALMAIGNVSKPITKSVSSDDFAAVVDEALTKTKGEFNVGDFLTRYTPEEYAAMETFLNPTNTAGYALKKMADGKGKELVSVFNIGDTPGLGPKLAAESALRGATTLDNYSVQDVLPKIYGKAGFEETGRFPFAPEYAAPGTSQALMNAAPDYVTMQLSKNNIDTILRTRFLTPDEYLTYTKTGKIPTAKLKDVQNFIALTTLGAGGVGTAAALNMNDNNPNDFVPVRPGVSVSPEYAQYFPQLAEGNYPVTR